MLIGGKEPRSRQLPLCTSPAHVWVPDNDFSVEICPTIQYGHGFQSKEPRPHPRGSTNNVVNQMVVPSFLVRVPTDFQAT